MINLLKADFFRLLKHKITLVSLIIALVLPLVMAGLYAALRAFLTEIGGEDSAEVFGAIMNGGTLMLSSFSLTNNFGLVLPVFLVIGIMSDVSSGTIRNKIILGYKRHQIFASHFITAFVYAFVIMSVYAAFSALWGIVLLGAPELTSEGQLSYLYYYVLGLLGLAMVAALASCLSLSTLNSAGSIIISLAICIVIGFIASILSTFLNGPDIAEYAKHIVRFIPSYVNSYASVGNITSIMFLEGLGGIAIFTAIPYFLGTYLFSKRDLK